MPTKLPKNANTFIEILSDFWGKFKQKYPSFANDYYDSIIQKTISCGDPKFGYIEYGCMHCGESKHLVAFSSYGELANSRQKYAKKYPIPLIQS